MQCAPQTDFLAGRTGSFAVIGAVLMPPLIGAAGLAVDYSNAVRIKTANQDALDAALLASASPGGNGAIRKLANKVFADNNGSGEVENPECAQVTFSEDMMLFVREKGKTAFKELGRVTCRYDAVRQVRGPMETTFDPKKPVMLANAAEAYFAMRIDPKSPFAENLKHYSLRTNDPATSSHVFC